MTQKFSPILVKTIKRLENSNPEAVLKIADLLTFSKNQELRKIARHYLGLTDLETKHLYSTSLKNPSSSIKVVNIALVELTSLLNAEAIDLLQVYAAHKSPSIRRTSLQLIARLLNDGAKSHLIKGMLDEASPVQRESTRLCVQFKIGFSALELIKLYKQQPTQVVFDSVLLLARKNGKWVRLSVLLNILAMVDEQPEVVQRINVEIMQWNSNYNLCGSQVSNADLINLRFQTAKISGLISSHNLNSLKFTFDTLICK